MLKNKIFPLFVLLSFIIGFIFSEDTLGGGKNDYLYHEKYFVNFYNDFFTTLKNYGMDQANENVRNSPFFYIIFSLFLKMGFGIDGLKFINLIIIIPTIIFFNKCLNINYKNPYIIEHIQTNGWMIMPIIPYSYNSIDFGLGRPAPSPPLLKHILGTDAQARDLLSRLIYGFRISLIFGLILTFASTILGVCAGAVQGYFGGWIDLIFQRFIEIWSGLPTLFIMIILSSILIPNFWWILGIVLLFQWTSLVGVVRAEFLKTRKQDYVTAARATGITHKRIIFQHILPNAMIATLTMLPFILNGSITTLTALDFLGFGLPPDEPSLGELLSQGKDNLFAPWIGISAFLVIGTILTLLIFIGEGVRDTLDPKYAKLRSEKDPS